MRTFNGVHKGTRFELEERIEGGTSLIRRSPFSGTMTKKDFDVPFETFMLYYNGGGLIQNLFPMLNADEREFIMTGITPKEWNELFGE